MRVLAGTSGYAFKEWKGSFYPETLADDGLLGFYASRLPAVEINNTFYRMPRERVLLSWAEQVPPGFRFALKASQRITHQHRLQGAEESLAYFLRIASALGERLGPTLFQLPPNLKQDLPRLEAFLQLLPRRWKAAFEFRHPTWFVEATWEALAKAGAALCVAEGDDLESPLVATAPWGYVRLHRAAYPAEALRAWAERIRRQPWEEAYVFFKHEGAESGPGAAARFLALVNGEREAPNG
ncbi:MAG TPA: DUF72 domain-containing protein [Gemmatimonadales bacterium]|nr:DUF72 domain-containing protein [Gemmatimonadales bacterium]